MLQPNHRAWVEIDLNAVTSNVKKLKQLLRPETGFMAVVKADAYGHGAVAVAKAAIAGGASWLGVATIEEGIELRQQGITVPILVLGATTTRQEAYALLEYRLQPTVSNLAEAQLCQGVAQTLGLCLPVHVKIDTGMSRLGVLWHRGAEFIEAVQKFSCLDVVGLYSHLATADEPDTSFVAVQHDRFRALLSCFAIPYGHLCNTAGLLLDRALHYNLVRVGLGIYGYVPAPHFQHLVELQPAMTVKARISHIKTLPPGTGVSYGHHFYTTRETRLGVVTIGYADGLSRGLSNRVQFQYQDKSVAQIGMITMDQCMVDLTDLPQVQVGDTLTVMANAMDWASKLHTIPWEILCSFKQRLPRLICDRNKNF
ncbi:MAG: alanine racemase [Pseudanabaenaceae cyanobacterium SKYGB_i_bin29]|nr:alanine racemase [Pseudanabaenaceae cyanobacterium SKYG29]MDW8422507.1 alanine racemase [Pseudanabaenaceae cyanobacterium SKYGB_i_bin29]